MAKLPSTQAVLFDAYGTLFDVYSVALTAEQLFPGNGDRLSALWRDKQIEYSRLTSMSGRYQPFWELTQAALRYAALRLGLNLSDSAQQRLMDEYRCLKPFVENLEVLQALRKRGVPAGILSNGNPEMLNAAVKSAGFDALLDPVLSIHDTRRYKTDPAAYALGTSALGLPAQAILFVSSNAWDALGASWYGYTTLWVNRAGLPAEQLDPPPHRIARNLREVLDFFPIST